MEDYHVDRPGVEVQQCMKLTGTNNSIGLKFLYSNKSLCVMVSDNYLIRYLDNLVVMAKIPYPIPFRTRK